VAAGRPYRCLRLPPSLFFHFLCPHSCPSSGTGSIAHVTIILTYERVRQVTIGMISSWVLCQCERTRLTRAVLWQDKIVIVVYVVLQFAYMNFADCLGTAGRGGVVKKAWLEEADESDSCARRRSCAEMISSMKMLWIVGNKECGVYVSRKWLGSGHGVWCLGLRRRLQV
jgi:hypothetical protein